ncbi:hypothetical protein NC651_026419 [Populus alba x Populus x berolinensis]|nr:hypothetical protein NC651_026419 [Populus alba x Populus x berolinensis]
MASATFRAKTKIVASNDARALAWKSIVYYFSLELSLCCLIVEGHATGFDNEQRTWLPCFLPSFSVLTFEVQREWFTRQNKQQKHFISLKKKKKKLSS